MRTRRFLFAFSIIFFPILMSPPTSAQTMQPLLNLKTAQDIRDGCVDYAIRNNINMAIAVYDVHGQLKLFTRMDNTTLGTANAAKWKGLSAASYQYSSAETAIWNVPTAPDIATSRGGLPIKTKDGKALGGVGVSGAASSVDELCAKAGLVAADLYFGDTNGSPSDLPNTNSSVKTE